MKRISPPIIMTYSMAEAHLDPTSPGIGLLLAFGGYPVY